MMFRLPALLAFAIGEGDEANRLRTTSPYLSERLAAGPTSRSGWRGVSSIYPLPTSPCAMRKGRRKN